MNGFFLTEGLGDLTRIWLRHIWLRHCALGRWALDTVSAHRARDGGECRSVASVCARGIDRVAGSVGPEPRAYAHASMVSKRGRSFSRPDRNLVRKLPNEDIIYHLVTKFGYQIRVTDTSSSVRKKPFIGESPGTRARTL